MAKANKGKARMYIAKCEATVERRTETGCGQVEEKHRPVKEGVVLGLDSGCGRASVLVVKPC